MWGQCSLHLKIRNGKSVVCWNVGNEYSLLGQFVLASGRMQVLSCSLSMISCSSNSLNHHFLLWLILVPLVLGASTGLGFVFSFSLEVLQFFKKKEKMFDFLLQKQTKTIFVAFLY